MAAKNEEKEEVSKVTPLKVGINGFGRIGRMVTRIAAFRQDIDIVGINDPFLDPDYMAYQLKYDSSQGKFKGTIKVLKEKSKDDKELNYLVVNAMKIRVFKEFKAENIGWKECGAQIVTDCTGLFTEVGDTARKGFDATLHLKGGAKKVVISAPSKTAPMYCMNINTSKYDSKATVISNASCTTNCLAPIAKVMHDTFGIKQGLMTTVHSITATQKTVDGINQKKIRSGRGGLQNIIPTSTGAAAAIGKVITDLDGKLNGMAFRVPVACGSVVDLTVQTTKDVTKDAIDKAMKKAADGELKGVLSYCDEEIVSSDIIGESCSCIYDSKASMIIGKNFVKIVAWYDNEWGYSCRLVDLCVFAAKKDGLCK